MHVLFKYHTSDVTTIFNSYECTLILIAFMNLYDPFNPCITGNRSKQTTFILYAQTSYKIVSQ